MNKIEEGIISTKGQEMVGWEEIMDHERNIIAVIITITITILLDDIRIVVPDSLQMG